MKDHPDLNVVGIVLMNQYERIIGEGMAREMNEAAHQSLSSVRLLKIIECLSEKHFPVRLTDLSKELEMTQPTVLRYLNALCSYGYAYQDYTTGNYSLTWKVCGIGANVLGNTNIRNIVSPYINQMANELNIGMLLSVEKNGDIIYLDMALNPGNPMETLLRIGKDAPIHSTASGKILLSYHTNKEIEVILERKGMARLTENTITDPASLLEELEQIRNQRYALDNEECEIGHRCVSVALYDYTGQAVAAISAFHNTDMLGDDRIRDQILPALHKASRELSYLMGWQP